MTPGNGPGADASSHCAGGTRSIASVPGPVGSKLHPTCSASFAVAVHHCGAEVATSSPTPSELWTAGPPIGTPAAVIWNTTPATAETVAEIVQANLTEVGFKIEVEVQEGGTFGEATKEANAKRQLFYTGFTSNPDPSWSTVWFTCDQVNVWNWMSWCNKEYSRLDKEAARTLDDSKRHEMYLQMQQLIVGKAITGFSAFV